MQAAKNVAPADHLERIHQTVVARFIGMPVPLPSGKRVRPGGDDAQTHAVGDFRNAAAQACHLPQRLGRIRKDRRDHLDLRLLQLERNLLAQAFAAGSHKFL